MERYFAQAQQVVTTPEDLVELCLLITHCFEDQFEAKAVQEDAKLLYHASTLIVDSLDGIQSQGKTWQQEVVFSDAYEYLKMYMANYIMM